MLKARLFLVLAALGGALLLAGGAAAHFPVYFPKTPGCYGKAGEASQWTYFWGHPYEMIIYDATAPSFFMHTPQGKKDAVQVREIKLPDQASGQERRAYEVEYKPAVPGDYLLCLEGQPFFVSEEKLFWQDFVKEVWHVTAEKGWSARAGLDMEIVPLTRPYGWPAGSVFQGQALFKGRPLRGAIVEVEKLSGSYVPKESLPQDRFGEENGPLMTRVVKTDAQGLFVCTLDSPGWWIISVSHQDGKMVYEGKPYPVEKRGCLWVYAEPASAGPGAAAK